jgi:acylphosphatase
VARDKSRQHAGTTAGDGQPTEDRGADQTRLTAWVHGRVQGVGFRWWTRAKALELGLSGSASNLADGRVEVVAEGSRPACRQLLDALRSGTTPGRVDTVVERWSDARGTSPGFVER